jgi:hypothetical protein
LAREKLERAGATPYGFRSCLSERRKVFARPSPCDDLWRYLTNNVDALINYGARYRSKLPISTSRAEGRVDEIANARMAKKQRMRWSPRGAHCVATVRAAMLDGRSRRRTIFA